MESVRKWKKSSTEDLCLYSLLKVYGISEEMDQEPHKGFMRTLSIESVLHQSGNGPGAAQMTSAHIPY
jgi:hypothetical protein